MPIAERTENKRAHVASVLWKGHFKRLRLEPGSHWLAVPLSACVTKGDEIEFSGKDFWVPCKNGKCRLMPPYVELESLTLGGLKLQVLIKEITEKEEHDAYQSLTEFHYRGHQLHGRTARLIVRAADSRYPTVLGFIELATPFYVNKPRATVLDTRFKSGCIAWERWDRKTLQQYIHVLARIARTVVYPEFRGLGIGQILIKHAIQFARKRWQVAGYRPLFLEISADMLKFVPFAEKAGMVYAGETEGNLHRVEKDMRYLLRRFGSSRSGQTDFEGISGICDQQVARKDRSLHVMRSEGLTRAELLSKLRSLSKQTVLKDYALLHGIVSLPKPHYMLGLNKAAASFVEKRIEALGIRNGLERPRLEVTQLSDSITLKDVSISYRTRVRRTRSTHAVQQAFGISPDLLQTVVVRDLSVRIEPRDVVLILGPSGSGKTSLLNAIQGRTQPEMAVSGLVDVPGCAKIGSFSPIRSRKPLIDVIGNGDVGFGLYLLSVGGLSEAYLYLKRFQELSAGQKYRAMLCRLVGARRNVWLADEFCANLDAVTANVLAHNVQRTARKLGVTLVVAAPHCSAFLDSLDPDLVISLSSGWDHRLYTGAEFRQLYDHNQGMNGKFPSLSMLPRFIQMVRAGKKCSTIRLGRRTFQKGLLLLRSRTDRLPVKLVDVSIKRVADLTPMDAIEDGFRSIEDLREELGRLYPRITRTSMVTIVHFKNL